jgi:hypothetical protein
MQDVPMRIDMLGPISRLRITAGVLAGLVWLALAANALAAPSLVVDYLVEFQPDDGTAAVTITLEPGEGRILNLDFAMDPERYSGISGDGELEIEDGRAVWQPPRDGGSLQFEYRIDKQRRDGGYDARITDNWVIVRGDHLVPAARARFSPGARTRARLRFKLPEDWTAFETPYVRDPDAEVIEFDNPERRFVRPVGWIIAGDLGIRREWLEGMEMAVAAPRGEAKRRNDILAFANMLAAEFKAAFGELPPKLLVVGAGDPMWRGGLSGPNSLYLHADRPLVGEGGSSTLVHEMVHVITRIAGRGEDRWIGEGIADFYSVELMRRAGTITERRAKLAFERKERRGRTVKTLLAPRSSGARTDRAVTLFAELDREIRELSEGELDLDDLVQRLMRIRQVDRHQLADEFEQLVGQPSQVLRKAPLEAS